MAVLSTSTSKSKRKTLNLISQEDRIPPSRGLVLTHNHRGKAFAPTDVKRWIRYNRLILKTAQIDIVADGESPANVETFLHTATELDALPSLRTDCAAAPPSIASLRREGLHGVFLCPPSLDGPFFQQWLEACRDNGIGVRIQIRPPFPSDEVFEKIGNLLAGESVNSVSVALTDPLWEGAACSSPKESEQEMQRAAGLTCFLRDAGVSVTLANMPMCLMEEDLLENVANPRQSALDHEHYTLASYALASSCFRRPPFFVGQAILILLARHMLRPNPLDNLLLPWMLSRPRVHTLIRVWRRLTRHMNVLGSVPQVASKKRYEYELAKLRRENLRDMGPDCARCSLRGICAHFPREFVKQFPGLEAKPKSGDVVVSPQHFCVNQPKFYDVADEVRRDGAALHAALAKEALERIGQSPPTRIIGSAGYGVEDCHFDRMEGGIKWYSVSNSEKLSTPLARLEPPFTLSVDFGAGIADFAGFSLGRHCKLVCPMEAYRHTLTLHVNAEGYYVLLRDRQPMRPVEFDGLHYLPLRLGGPLEPRISLWNIEEMIATQNISLWEGDTEEPDVSAIKYSIILVCTRFSRRLQAVLRNIAHQKDFDLSKLEVIVSYVPGLDGTDDLIDSMSLAFPEIRFVRSPFPEQNMKSKGFLINETFRKVAGDWVMLLDSDTLIPPNMFAEIEKVADTEEFIAPDGRKLLTKETTAKVLLGEVEPWESWEELLAGAGEFRHREARGVPVGFCQCFRSKYLRMFPYAEVEHFESSDMWFGEAMIKHLGSEHRLSGSPVIHLDHGGSQWYGTQRHL